MLYKINVDGNCLIKTLFDWRSFMIDKEKTIEKAISKYHSIYPARGKRSLYDCFFRLRGEHYFVFRTQDKKVHTVKACIQRNNPVNISGDSNGEKRISIIETLNKPIILRSLIVKKPIGTWLINLFPSPHISWSIAKTQNVSTDIQNIQMGQNSSTYQSPCSRPSVVFNQNEMTVNSYRSAYKSQNIEENCNTSTANPYVRQHNYSSQYLRIIARGYLPLTYIEEWLPVR